MFWYTGIAGSAEIFDPSCADIVGHDFEAFGDRGYTASHPSI